MSDDFLGEILNEDEIESMRDASLEAAELRKKYSNMLIYGDIDFSEFLQLAQQPENKALKKIKLDTLLGGFAGWSKDTARRALTSYGIRPGAKVYDCINHELYRRVMYNLISSSSTSWQKRVKAPEGWPWFGNILAAMRDVIGDEELPHEVRNAVRFDLGDINDKKGNAPSEEETEEDIRDDSKLSAIFSDSEEDDDDDFDNDSSDDRGLDIGELFAEADELDDSEEEAEERDRKSDEEYLSELIGGDYGDDDVDSAINNIFGYK